MRHPGGSAPFTGGSPAEPPRPRTEPSAFFGRLVVALVISTITLVILVISVLAVDNQPIADSTAPHAITVAGHRILISRSAPSMGVVAIALLAIGVIAACCLALEAIAAFLSINPRRVRLQQLRERSGHLPVAGEPVVITVVIPAHDEEASLPATLEALGQQSRPPDRVIVIADNCTDRTEAVARAMGVDVFTTVDNDQRKAGALNQALSGLLPRLDARDVVLVMDADTRLDERFLEVGAAHLENDPELAAVGGVFYGEDGHGIIGQLQRNEYTRYSLQIHQRRGRVFVLTGTATMFRSDALLDVAAARGLHLPGTSGEVYDAGVLTEDNELTMALKTLGATMASPEQCRVTTELMPDVRSLFRQRQRWQRGALENLASYGLTRGTLRYWGQQIGIGYGTVALNAFLVLIAITVLAVDDWIWFPFWLLIGSVFLVERIATAWSAGWRGRLLAAALLPELAYDVFQQFVFVTCLINILLNRRAGWGHVSHAPIPGSERVDA